MKFPIILFWFQFAFPVVPLAYGQSIPSHLVQAENFSIEQGLSDRYVNSFAKDKQGFFWVATDKGLNRFDGYEFLIYDARPSNPHRIWQNKIHSILTDREGNLLLIYDFLLSGVMGLLDPQTGKSEVFKFDSSSEFQGKFIDVKHGKDGTIFFVNQSTLKRTIFRFEEKQKDFVKQFEITLSPSNKKDFLPASDGTFWVADVTTVGDEFTLTQYDSTGRQMDRFGLDNFTGAAFNTSGEIKLAETGLGDILLYAEKSGVWLIPQSRQTPFNIHPQLKGTLYEFEKDTKGNMLAYQPNPAQVTHDCVMLTADGKVENYGWIMDHQTEIRNIFSDDFTKGFLAGTGDGFNSFQIRPNLFQTLLSTPNLGKTAYGTSIRGMAKLGPNKLFIATEVEGLYELDLITQTLSRPGDRMQSLEELNTLKFTRNMLAEGDSVLWITGLAGVIKYNDTASKLQFYSTYDGPVITGDQETWGIAKDKDGQYWVVTRDGRLLVLKPGKEEFETYTDKDGRHPLSGTQPSFLISAKDGSLWAGTSLSGLFRIDPVQGLSKNYSADAADPSGITSNHISCIYEDEEGMLWLGTMESGLHLFDPQKGKVVGIFDRTNGLRNNSVVGILPDSKGNFWVSTFSGLSYLDTNQKSFRNFTTANGLSHNEFNRHAFFFDSDDSRFYFGGMNGVNSFKEETISAIAQNASLLISEMWVTDLKGKTTGQQEGILDGTTITMAPGSRFLRLKLSLLTFGNNSGNQFAYKLDGAGNDWNYLGQGRDLRIDYPPAGKHTLRIKGADIHGNWSSDEITLKLDVQEFWYKRWWAWALYTLVLAAAGIYFYRFQLSRTFAKKEASRLQQLDDFKTRFFTNISHEFRTPLTVILGMVDLLKRSAMEGKSTEAEEHSEMIKRNSRHLLNLVNQLLDLARLESGKLHLSPANGDLVSFIQYQVESFRSYAHSRGIDLSFQSDRTTLEMALDYNKMQGILVNLISNALKFTPEAGKVFVDLKTVPFVPGTDPKEIIITVMDTGIGIAQEDLDSIFDRFYQVDSSSTRKDSGTGVGLALVQELVKLMNGSVSVDSQPGLGTSFIISLPFTAVRAEWNDQAPEAAKGLEESIEEAQGIEEETSEGTLPVLLIVEDNRDVRLYIYEILKEQYRITMAVNGAEGIEKAREMVPDLIISDVMMPVNDGFELCKVLKADELTSHVPIILLTARADAASRIAGLKRGADAYLAKPFEPAELLVHAENLIRLRRQLQKRYASVAQLPQTPSPDPDLELEDAFIIKIKEVIKQDLQSETFDIPELGKALGMSRSQLFRKVKALTGTSPSLLVRSIRLQEAQILLRDTDLNIAEIAYEVGFSTPAYFSTAFLEEFGSSPSEWRLQVKNAS